MEKAHFEIPEDGKINTLDSAHLRAIDVCLSVSTRRTCVCVCNGYGQSWMAPHRNRIVKMESANERRADGAILELIQP